MSRTAIIFLACLIAYTILFVFIGEALTAPLYDQHAILVTEQIQARERHERKLRHERQLRRDYRDWLEHRRVLLRQRVHGVAVRELGVTEYGYNTVPRYGVCGIPWCAQFVGWCVSRSEADRPLPPNPNSTSSWRRAILEQCRGLAQVHRHANVRAGDLVCFPAHMGIVHRPGSDGFWSIEGNASDAVRLRWHPWQSADTFGRLRVVAVPARFQCVTD